MDRQWNDGRTLLGDCLVRLPEIKSNSVDLVLTDLPYAVTQNPIDRPIDLARLWPELWRVCRSDAAIVMTAQFPFTGILWQSQAALFRYDLVWDKQLVSGHLNAKRQPLRSHEQILVFYRKQPTYNPQFSVGRPLHSEGQADSGAKVFDRNYGSYNRKIDRRKGVTQKYPRSIVSVQKPHPSVAVHPTEKPAALFEWLIRTYSDEGQLVLDCCGGSGTTAIAALNTGRQFCLIEKDQAIYDRSINRIDRHLQLMKA